MYMVAGTSEPAFAVVPTFSCRKQYFDILAADPSGPKDATPPTRPTVFMFTEV